MEEIGFIIVVGQETKVSDENRDLLTFIQHIFVEILTKAKVAVVITQTENLEQFKGIASYLKSFLQNKYNIEHERIIITQKCTSFCECCYYSKIALDMMLPNMHNVHLIYCGTEDEKFTEELTQQVFHEPAYKVKQHCFQYCSKEYYDNASTDSPSQYFKDNVSQILAKFASNLPTYDTKDISYFVSNVIPDSCFLHGFTTRYGGISTYTYQSSLNLCFNPKKKDSKFCVEENKKRLAKVCGLRPCDMKFPKCGHENIVWIPDMEPEPEKYDGLVTNQTGVSLFAPGADCAPILFADPVKKVCGVGHAGWKGIIAEIGKAVVKTMTTRFDCDAKDIRAAIGPCIGICCFEVGEEVSKQFTDKYGDVVVIQVSGGKPHVDLRRAIKLQLQDCGLLSENIDDRTRTNNVGNTGHMKFCTCCDEEKRFFSYRRDRIAFGDHAGFISIL